MVARKCLRNGGVNPECRMERSKTVLTAARGFFSTIGAGELDEVLKRIEQCLKK